MDLNDFKMMERIKQVVITHRAKVYTEAFYFNLNSGRE